MKTACLAYRWLIEGTRAGERVEEREEAGLRLKVRVVHRYHRYMDPCKKSNQNFWQKLETLVKRGGRKGERAELKMRTELFKVI